MTEMERRGCLAIDPWKVTYQPGSWDKRFARDLAAMAKADDWKARELTRNQKKVLWGKVLRYRKQIKEPGILHFAGQQLARIEQDELAEQGAEQARPSTVKGKPKPQPAESGACDGQNIDRVD